MHLQEPELKEWNVLFSVQKNANSRIVQRIPALTNGGIDQHDAGSGLWCHHVRVCSHEQHLVPIHPLFRLHMPCLHAVRLSDRLEDGGWHGMKKESERAKEIACRTEGSSP